jgi:Tfp pilus assembly protein PilZ
MVPHRTTGEPVPYPRKHRIHYTLLPGKLLCEACYIFLDTKKRVRTPEEVVQFLSVANLIAERAAGGAVVCSNCAAVEGSPASRGQHIANSEAGAVLCRRCDAYLRNTGTSRDPHLQRVLEGSLQIREDRKAGRPVVCIHCGNHEAAVQCKRGFIFGKTSLAPICRKCYHHRGLR